ncbi:MAG: hypothetical protein ABIP37_06180 [Methylotenera sp.]
MKLLFNFFATLTMLSCSLVWAGAPDCSGSERWPTSMAFGYLKDAGFINNENMDFEKTKTTRLASEKIGKDLYRQVHLVTFVKKSGETVMAITNSDASNEECSMSDVEVYLVSKQIGVQLPPNPSFKRDALKRAP